MNGVCGEFKIEQDNFCPMGCDEDSQRGVNSMAGAPSPLPTLFYCDSHCHLDYLLQNQKHGWMAWMVKTKLCLWWLKDGTCRYGDRCDFAHGPDDVKARETLQTKDLEAFALQHCVIQSVQSEDRNSKRHVNRQRRAPRQQYRLGCLVTSCCEIEAIEDTLQLVAAGSQLLDGRVFCTFGCHPLNSHEYTDEYEARLLKAFDDSNGKAVAWGECGLDYAKCWRSSATEKKKQMQHVFVRQIRIAVSRQLPLVVHIRDADEDTLQILRENMPAQHPVHIHAFRGSVWFLEHGLRDWPNCVFGTSGLLITSEWNTDAADVVKTCPLERLVLETDSPYLVDEPRDVLQIAARVAEIKGISIDKVLAVTSEACARFYGFPLDGNAHIGTMACTASARDANAQA